MDSKFEKQPFTLTMLGTLAEFFPDLKQTAKSSPYTKGAKVKNYPKGETLSIISSLIKTALPANTVKVHLKSPYPFQADEITVINGPKTDGSNVGEKIALGLAAILKAIARDQTLINIIAHSRGAVQSILIAHELESIQTISSSCATFEDVLQQLAEQQTQRHKGSPANNTPDFIETLKNQINLIPKEEQELWFNKLKTCIPQASINLFGIDPVPGDCFPITWYDERFFILPEIIKNTELIYYANERSNWGFTPIFPEVISKERQNFVRYSMPGHHGTGSSGNNGSQIGVIVSANEYKTTHVQKLMLYKLIHFLSKQHVAFNDGAHIFHQHTALGRKYLGIDRETKEINLSALDFPNILRKLYTLIAKNQPGYDAYNSTYYSFLGLSKQRRALHKGHTYSLFNDVFTAYSDHVNEEHALLMQADFFKIFGIDTQRKTRAEMLNTAGSVLEEHIKKIVAKQASILDSEMIRNNVLETFGIVIQQVCQHYVTDDWASIDKKIEKGVLYQSITDTLTQLKALSALDNPLIQEFIAALLLLSFTSINHTLVFQAQHLEKEFNYFQESIDIRLTRFFSALLMQVNHSENNASLILDEIINSDEYKQLPNYLSAIKITYIYKKLTGKGLEKYPIEQLILSYEEQFADTIEDFAKLYQQIETFIHDLAALQSLAPRGKIDVNFLCLLQQANGLIATAAERFYKEKPQSIHPVAETNLFIKLVEQHAIEHLGIMDPIKEKNQNAEITNAEASSFFSRTLSFFWNPMPRKMDSIPVQAPTNAEIIGKEDNLAPLSLN